MSRPRSVGFTLVEVLVALVILEIGVLASVGLLGLASDRLARAVHVEEAAGEVAAVADSLARARSRERGETTRGRWRIGWETDESGFTRVDARLAGAPPGPATLEVVLP